MNQTEQEVLSTLNELNELVEKSRAMSPKPSFQPLFARLDELAGKLPPGSDPHLRHYLHNKSYEKAGLLLVGRDAENQQGACGGDH